MSDYGIAEAELGDVAINAGKNMGFLYTLDPVELTDDDAKTILQASYR